MESLSLSSSPSSSASELSRYSQSEYEALPDATLLTERGYSREPRARSLGSNPIDFSSSSKSFSHRISSLFISSLTFDPEEHIIIPVQIKNQFGFFVSALAMIDSGATSNFMHPQFSTRYHIKLARKAEPQILEVVDGRPISSGDVTHEARKVRLDFGNVHSELITFNIANIGQFPIILGLPWLKCHDPHIIFSKHKIKFSSQYCRDHCVKNFSSSKTFRYPTITSLPPVSSSFSEQEDQLNSSASDSTSSGTNSSSDSSDSSSSSEATDDDSVSTGENPGRRFTRFQSESNRGAGHLKAPKYAFVNAAGFKRSVGDGDVYFLHPRPKKQSIAASSSISAELAAQQRAMENALKQEDPSLHPQYPRNLIPKEYQDFEDVFSKVKASRLPDFRGPGLDHEINILPGTTPPTMRMIPLSAKELDAVEKYLDEHLPTGYIRASQSSAGAPILFVKKKDGSLRFCVDYRGLNKITLKNKYPLPLISESLDRLNGAKFFTKLDLRNGYYNVRIKKGDEWKTAFRTRRGLFEYTTMPFGLTNAPATFQHLVNHIFRDMLDIFVVVYLDDILIFSKNEDEHREHVRRVLQRLRENDLFAKPEKCEFHVDTVEYLGFIVSPTGISMDSVKVQAISEWEPPKSVHDLQVFLGFANYYRRFIRDYSKIAQPLTSLLKKEAKLKRFSLSPDQVEAFNSLKLSFTSAPILAHYDPSRPCVLEADSSDFAISGVLSQYDDQNILHPIAFYSRKLSPPELNYDIGDKELLAIVDCIKHWRRYLESDIHPLTVYSDHKNLQSFMVEKVLTRRQVRWMIYLSEFDFVIKYRTGKLMGKPDAMTRRHQLKEGTTAREQKPQILLPPSRFDIPPTIPSQIFALRLSSHKSSDIPLIDRILEAQASDPLVKSTLPYLLNIDLPRSKDVKKKLEGYSVEEDGLL